MNYRYLRPQGTAPTVPYTREWFHYGYNDRLVKMQTEATGMKTGRQPPVCVVNPPYSLSFSLANKMEWQYSYSPSGEREIKRLVLSPTSDSSCGTVFPWTYYLHGVGDEQQVVYHGRQISRGACDGGPTERRVFFYPVEYRSYGVDGVNIVWERDANGAMVARFVGTDIQGSERYAVGKNAYQKVRDYLPFGVDVAVANDQRRGYLGKESDYETAPQFNVVLNANLYHERLVDMSARKYSKTQGAFTGVDALWSQSVGYSSYAYSFHDPINFMDPTGLVGGGNGGGGISNPLIPNPRTPSDFQIFVTLVGRMNEDRDIRNDQLMLEYDQLMKEMRMLDERAPDVVSTMSKLLDGPLRASYEVGEARTTPTSIVETGGAAGFNTGGDLVVTPFPITSTGTINISDFQTEGYRDLRAFYHNHTRYDENGYLMTALPPSLPDMLVVAFRAMIQGSNPTDFIGFVESQNVRYAVVLTDPNAATRFVTTFGGQAMSEVLSPIVDLGDLSPTAGIQLAGGLARMINLLPTGIRIYTTNREQGNHVYRLLR